MKLNDELCNQLRKIQKFWVKYRVLVNEYPYLKRVVFHLSILALSLLLILLSYFPIFHRLGVIFDWLQFLAVLGLFYGVIVGSAPYIKLDATAKPYKTLMGSNDKRIRSHRPGRDLMIGVVTIFISIMVIAIFLAVFDTTTDVQIVLFMAISLILFLTGIYFFIRSLRLKTLSRWLFRTIRHLLSFSWWKGIIEILSNSTFSVSFDRRNRVERLQDEIMSNALDTENHTETLYEALRRLNQEDYLILSVKNKPKLFVQFCKMVGHYRLELPLTRTETNKRKLITAINTLSSKNVLKGFMLGPLQLNPHTYYYQDSWSDGHNSVTGDLLAIICKDSLFQATELGLAIMSEVHHWDGKTHLDYKVDTFNDSWWNRL